MAACFGIRLGTALSEYSQDAKRTPNSDCARKAQKRFVRIQIHTSHPALRRMIGLLGPQKELSCHYFGGQQLRTLLLPMAVGSHLGP